MIKDRNWKTTLMGIILAVMTAVEPVLSGTGYHLDKASMCRVIFIGAIALLGYLAKDR
jgi:hypothetical protein